MAKRGPQGKRGHSRSYALEPAQEQKLMSTCSTIEERIIVGMPLYCGLRASEVGHMRLSWIVSGDRLRIPLQEACDCAGCLKRGGYWRPKTRAGHRTLYVSGQIRDDLLDFLKAQPNGLRLSRQAVYHRTKDILLRAGVKFKGTARGTAFPHALRSSCATKLAVGGMDTLALCNFMGWSSIKVADAYIMAVKGEKLAQEQAQQILG